MTISTKHRKPPFLSQIRLTCSLAWLIFVAIDPSFSLAQQSNAKPNFLIILADDLGYSDLGCYGSEIATPNLDSLAQNGLRFSQFYNTARCWPTRAALLTGYYAQQVGRDRLPNLPGGTDGVRPAWAPLLPKHLKPLGYRSYLSGKWHVDSTPIKEGFEASYTLDDHDRFFYPKNHTENDHPLEPILPDANYYATTYIASHAIQCITRHSRESPNAPFFQYLAFTAPHFPLQAPEEDIQKYRGKYDAGWDVVREARWKKLSEQGLIHCNLAPSELNIGPPYDRPKDIEALGAGEVNRELPWSELTPEQQRFQATKMEVHAAMIDRMDQEIGRVLQKLRELNLFENTLILFLSDNGTSAEIMMRGDGNQPNASAGSGQSYLCLGPGWSKVGNTPFRRHKTWVHEGGISTPMIAHWPKGISAKGELRTQPAHVIDIAPTLLNLAGGEWPSNFAESAVPKSPGRSLDQTLQNNSPIDRNSLWWFHEGNRAFRQGEWKLVAAKGMPWELYHLKDDRSETNDVASQFPDRVKQMAFDWEAEAEAMANKK